MNQQLKQAKEHIRAFLRTPIWTDEKLCALLAHAQDKLSMWSCCCLIGFPTGDHAALPAIIRRNVMFGDEVDIRSFGIHYNQTRRLPLSEIAEDAFFLLGNPLKCKVEGEYRFRYDRPESDELRRRRIRPIIRRELREREMARLLRSELQLPLQLTFDQHEAEREATALLSA